MHYFIKGLKKLPGISLLPNYDNVSQFTSKYNVIYSLHNASSQETRSSSTEMFQTSQTERSPNRPINMEITGRSTFIFVRTTGIGLICSEPTVTRNIFVDILLLNYSGIEDKKKN
jgi:hypothetical protein